MKRSLEAPAGAPPPMAWTPLPDSAVAPAVQLELLARGYRASPGNFQVAIAYGRALMDRLAFDEAIEPLAAAVAAAPSWGMARLALAECQLRRQDFAGALSAIDFVDPAAPAPLRAQASYVRGSALAGAGEVDAAYAELRATLAVRPDHSPAFRKLSTLMLEAQRNDELNALCDDLRAQGVRHSRLLSVRACVLATLGRLPEAAALLDMRRVRMVPIGTPTSFATLADFNAELIEELIDHPYTVKIDADRAYAGRRVHHLLHGRRPEMIRALIEVVRQRMEAFIAELRRDADDWSAACPARARLDFWAIVQYGADNVGWHIHPNAWLSAVYYPDAPPTASVSGEGPGCLEFGAPPGVVDALADIVGAPRIAPEAGLLVMAPSHFHHRTIATGSDAPRVSVAFDLAPTDLGWESRLGGA